MYNFLHYRIFQNVTENSGMFTSLLNLNIVLENFRRTIKKNVTLCYNIDWLAGPFGQFVFSSQLNDSSVGFSWVESTTLSQSQASYFGVDPDLTVVFIYA